MALASFFAFRRASSKAGGNVPGGTGQAGRQDGQLPAHVEQLGTLAASCELWAADPQTHYWEKAELLKRARSYRQEQGRALTQYIRQTVREIRP